ncbi:MAG: transcriptional repressor [Bacteroidetes bacterium]|nr:transcriptional repressor [Bacteroidota bacterium]MBU1115474.1 transcriptional repressor [Bacteroidota bacterium]MBU1798151.1 transcriptional repressor [Bacteroidota bacterium]
MSNNLEIVNNQNISEINEESIPISVSKVSKILQDSGVSPSIQRIKILQFISNDTKHSSVDRIYSELMSEIPTLSKTTVYNTLSLFVKKGIINSISIDNHEILYEHSQKPHAHFLCEVCNEIFDIDSSISIFNIKEMNGHKIRKADVYLSGVCKKCLEKSNEIIK